MGCSRWTAPWPRSSSGGWWTRSLRCPRRTIPIRSACWRAWPTWPPPAARAPSEGRQAMQIPDKIGQLKSLALLQHLSEGKLAELAPFLDVRSIAADTILFEEGSAGDTMFFLAAGQIRIEKKVAAGGFKELALLSPGDFFGEMAVIE